MGALWLGSWAEAPGTAEPSAARADTSLLTTLPMRAWLPNRQGFHQAGNVLRSDGNRETGPFEIIADRFAAATQTLPQEGFGDRDERLVVLGAGEAMPYIRI